MVVIKRFGKTIP